MFNRAAKGDKSVRQLSPARLQLKLFLSKYSLNKQEQNCSSFVLMVH